MSFKSEIGKKVPDSIYLKRLYKKSLGKKLNLKNPQTFNEKLQWLKLYERKDLYTCLVDKYAVKEYVSKKIGKNYIIPTIGVWNDFDDIDFTILPNEFILKCNGDSGSVIICRDKSTFNIEKAKEKLNYHLKKNGSVYDI